MKITFILTFYCLMSAGARVDNKIVVCEGSNVTMECNQQETINVTKVYYGHGNDKIKCGSDLGLPSADCFSFDAFGLLAMKCNGMSRCSFLATGRLFSLSCPGSKYLDMEYTCIPNKLIECEDDTVSLSCTDSKVILVVSAFYGRGDKKTCPHSSLSNFEHGCFDTDALEDVSEECNGKKTCNFDADYDFFDEDPCPGIYKYLKLQYQCI